MKISLGLIILALAAILPFVSAVQGEENFGNIVSINGRVVQCGDDIVSQHVLEDGTILGEECEDGNTQDGDGCSSTCQKEFCGNGRVEAGEDCDPGQPPTSPPTVPPYWNQAIPAAECDRFCDYVICGDGIVNGDEQCDDGNEVECDGCSADCKLQPIAQSPCNFSCTSTCPLSE